MSEYSSEKEFLQNYSIHDYDIPLLSVDMAIFTLKEECLQILLVKRAEYPARGKWALPGGFIDVHRDKNLDQSAYRKLYEKTGVKTPYLEQVASFGSAKRDPRGWSVTVAYFALIASDQIRLEGDKSAAELRWCPVETLDRQLKLAFDHRDILDICLQRLKSKVEYTSLPVNLLPDEFTLGELQRTFEIILQQPLAKKSFRRRVLDANILEDTGKMRTGNSRPAKLYRALPQAENHFFARSLEGQR